jgi:hypothetical protein
METAPAVELPTIVKQSLNFLSSVPLQDHRELSGLYSELHNDWAKRALKVENRGDAISPSDKGSVNIFP